MSSDLGGDLPTATVKRVLGPSAVVSLSLADAAWEVEDRVVWGATAGMLMNLYRRVTGAA